MTTARAEGTSASLLTISADAYRTVQIYVSDGTDASFSRYECEYRPVTSSKDNEHECVGYNGKPVITPSAKRDPLPSSTGQASAHILHLSVLHRPVFLLNSCLGQFSAASSHWHSFSRSYGVILPSSLTMLLPSALGFSPHPPVSVYGTGTI